MASYSYLLTFMALLCTILLNLSYGLPQPGRRSLGLTQKLADQSDSEIQYNAARVNEVERSIEFYATGRNSIYFVNSTGYATQAFGSSSCASLGGALVTIETRAEDDEIAALLPDRNFGFEYWTSGTYSSASRIYFWTATGQSVLYENWDSSYYREGEEYAMTKYDRRDIRSRWHAHLGAHAYINMGYICEFPLEPNTTTTTTTTEPTTTTFIPTTPNDGSSCNNFQCPNPNGNFPDPRNCAAYYSCSGGICVGRQVCPDGLLFNPIRQICDYPSEVNCSS